MLQCADTGNYYFLERKKLNRAGKMWTVWQYFTLETKFCGIGTFYREFNLSQPLIVIISHSYRVSSRHMCWNGIGTQFRRHVSSGIRISIEKEKKVSDISRACTTTALLSARCPALTVYLNLKDSFSSDNSWHSPLHDIMLRYGFIFSLFTLKPGFFWLVFI